MRSVRARREFQILASGVVSHAFARSSRRELPARCKIGPDRLRTASAIVAPSIWYAESNSPAKSGRKLGAAAEPRAVRMRVHSRRYYPRTGKVPTPVQLAATGWA